MKYTPLLQSEISWTDDTHCTHAQQGSASARERDVTVTLEENYTKIIFTY